MGSFTNQSTAVLLPSLRNFPHHPVRQRDSQLDPGNSPRNFLEDLHESIFMGQACTWHYFPSHITGDGLVIQLPIIVHGAGTCKYSCVPKKKGNKNRFQQIAGRICHKSYWFLFHPHLPTGWRHEDPRTTESQDGRTRSLSHHGEKSDLLTRKISAQNCVQK